MKGVDVRPGSVREARQEAGLSLAGVADGQLTRAAIHLIETGRSRPSMPTLELIARRTGKPITYFLADSPGAGPRLPLDRVELALEEGRLEEAIELATELSRKASDRWSLGQLHCWLGQAHARALRPGPALTHLRQARAIAEDLHDSWLVVECLDWEAAALTTEEDPEALATAQRALELARSLEPRLEALEARILSRIGTFHLIQHDWARAVKAYQEALAAAGGLRDLSRVARIQQGLALAYGELGDGTRQIAYSQKALALYQMLRDRASIVGTENNLGLAFMRQGDMAAAEGHFRTALDLADDLGMEAMKAHPILSLAELKLLRGALSEAEQLVAAARKLADQAGERLSAGVAEMLDARIAAGHGRDVEADRHFAAALGMFVELGATERLIECHSAYADVLEARGDTRRALEQTKLALAATRPGLAGAPSRPEAQSQAG